MPQEILGLHHVTATVDGAQEDLDFFLGVLGLRLVKKTVNFDNHQVYHFYYGTERGAPGTIMTTFPYRGQGVRLGTKGTGQVTHTAFTVPSGSIAFWISRLQAAGRSVAESSRFGGSVLSVEDPSSLFLELVGDDEDPREPWTAGPIEAHQAIKGIHSVTLSLADPAATLELLTGTLGFEQLAEEGNRIRLGAIRNETRGVLELLREPALVPGVNGTGTVHHVALAISDERAQDELRAELLELGYEVSPVRDRKYFRSIYFRERGGVLFEVATAGPGFTVDEPLESLGRDLKLPEGEEGERPAIERALPTVQY